MQYSSTWNPLDLLSESCDVVIIFQGISYVFGCIDDKRKYKGMPLVPTFEVPSMSRHPKTGLDMPMAEVTASVNANDRNRPDFRLKRYDYFSNEFCFRRFDLGHTQFLLKGKMMLVIVKKGLFPRSERYFQHVMKQQDYDAS